MSSTSIERFRPRSTAGEPAITAMERTPSPGTTPSGGEPDVLFRPESMDEDRLRDALRQLDAEDRGSWSILAGRLEGDRGVRSAITRNGFASSGHEG
jgi:hypothetical protein